MLITRSANSAFGLALTGLCDLIGLVQNATAVTKACHEWQIDFQTMSANKLRASMIQR